MLSNQKAKMNLPTNTQICLEMHCGGDHLILCSPPWWIEKGACSTRAACAYFFTFVLIFVHVVFKRYLPFFVWHFYLFEDFEQFLHIICVLIFKARSFASAILSAFSGSPCWYLAVLSNWCKVCTLDGNKLKNVMHY